MPRALSRDEQAVLNYVRRTGGSVPIPDVARELGLETAAAQTAAEYLVERALLRASVYAVAPAAGIKTPAAAGS
jgi:hypothetical protein